MDAQNYSDMLDAILNGDEETADRLTRELAAAERRSCFDVGPEESYEKALQEFADRANRLIAWRENRGR